MKKTNIISSVVGSAVGIAFIASSIYYYKNPPKYSKKWIYNLNDDAWEIERELVRKKYASPDYSTDQKIGFKSLLDLFDKVKSSKVWAGQTPSGPSCHREHGYNLYKP